MIRMSAKESEKENKPEEEKEHAKEVNPMIDILSDGTNFEIILALFMNRELKLTELDTYTSTSRSTVHRHLQDLLEKNIILETKEIQERGGIPAKYFGLNIEKFMAMGQVSLDDIQNMPEAKRVALYLQMQKSYETLTNFLIRILSKASDYLQNLNPRDPEKFEAEYDIKSPPFFLALNLQSEAQKNLYLQRLQEFSRDLNQELIEKKLVDPKDPLGQKSDFLIFNGLIPIRDILLNSPKKKNEP